MNIIIYVDIHLHECVLCIKMSSGSCSLRTLEAQLICLQFQSKLKHTHSHTHMHNRLINTATLVTVSGNSFYDYTELDCILLKLNPCQIPY